MPTPIQLLTDPISLILLGLYGVMMVSEYLFPGRALPKIKGWWLRGLLSFLIYFYVSSYLPLLIDPYLTTFQLFDLSHLGTAWGVIIGILVYELGAWAYHYTIHKSDFLWRTVHQMHHSAERVDTHGAFYFSPLDMIGWTILGSVCFGVVLGLSPEAMTLSMMIIFYLAVFQHSNIRTPQWIGYIIQRPESHTYHHARGLHKCNYSDLPLYDMLFGTFKNPGSFPKETGFYNGASSRILDMLRFKLVDKQDQ